MKRYNAVQGGVYDNSVMVEERDGDWVWYEDVEAKCAELLEACLALAAMKNNDWNEHDSVFIGPRAAIVKAKGESNE